MAEAGVNGSSEESSDTEDEYEDAVEYFVCDSSAEYKSGESMSLTEAIRDTTKIMELFLNNHYDQARALLELHSSTSMYHALGYSTCMLLQATMTFSSTHIDAGIEIVRNAVTTCAALRRRSIFPVSHSGKSHCNNLTPLEIHAELCYADCLLQRTILSFVEDENMMGFIRGALKIKTCFNSYQECQRILERRDWKFPELLEEGNAASSLGCDCDPEELQQFQAGVAMGNGMFKLMISLLPSKVMKLLEFIGFSGDRVSGLRDLERGATLVHTVRGPLCCIALVTYHCLLTYALGSGEGDVELSARLMSQYEDRYSKAALFLFLQGRVEVCRGRLEEGIAKYEESIAAQNEWKQFHHLCFWEMMWCYAYMDDWVLAMKYAERLYNKSRWSVSTYAYVKAAFMMMLEEGQAAGTRKHINQLLEEVPKNVQRRAGKSIPVEKFAVRKASRYFAQNHQLVLAAHELFYIWSGLLIVGKKRETIDIALSKVEKALSDVRRDRDSLVYYADDYALATFLKGVLLRMKGDLVHAQTCLNEVLSLDREVTQDRYLLPSALYELALIHLETGRLIEAKQAVHNAKHNFKNYCLESRVLFRVQSVESRIKAAEATIVRFSSSS